MQRTATSALSASPRVLGIDPSLNGTGVAYRKNGRPVAVCLSAASKLRGMDRLIYLRNLITFYMSEAEPTLVAFEGLAMGFGNKGTNNVLNLAELAGILKLLIFEKGVDILLVPPKTLKRYITGQGNADKAQVAIAVQEELGVLFSTSDQYDATGLMLMGEAYLDRRLLPRDRRHHKRESIQACQLLPALRS